MHPFDGFDFTQAPELTALDDLLQNQLGLVNSTNHSAGCFIPLPAQTGIGKTHTACALMLERLLLNIKNSSCASVEQAPDLTYYITNSVDNVRNSIHGLMTLIERQKLNGKPRFTSAQQAFIKSQIVHLHSQDDQLLSLTHEDRQHILTAYKLIDSKEINDAFFELDSLAKAAALNSVVNTGFRESARQLYMQLKSLIRMALNEHNIALSEAQQEAVFQLLPGEKVLQGKACILFMTTKKFMHGFYTTTSRIDPIKHVTNCLLIIDEIDRQNVEILQVLSEAKGIDLVEFGKRLSANLSHHELERSPRYDGVEAILAPILQRTHEHAQTWQMKYHFMIEGNTLNDQPIRLFSDRSITHAHSALHYLNVHTDSQRQKNIIVAKDKAGFDTDNTTGALSRFVNESDWLFRDFTRAFQWSAQRVIHNEKPKRQGMFERHNQYLGAVTSLLVHYGLQDYRSIVMDVFSTRIKTFDHPRSRLSKRSYHDNGLKLTEVSRIPDAEDTMACFYKSMNITPTGLLAQMVDDGAAILGISATANSPTVIHNFDHGYLRTRLGARYVSLSSAQRQAVGAYYNSRRRYAAAGIAINCHYLRKQTDNINAVIELHEGRPPRDLETALQGLLKNAGALRFAPQWFSKLLSAMELFAQHRHSRFMVALLGRTFVVEQAAFITTLETYLSRQSDRPVRIFAGINAGAMKDGRYEHVQNHLSDTLDKVILISAYQTMGEGKNPDYLVRRAEDKSTLNWVGDGAEKGECRGDIDALYLEKPTNVLVTHDDTKINLILMLHQIMSLQNSGYLSPNAAKQWVRDVLTGNASMHNTRLYNKTDDAPWAIRRIIKQAVGRMARTAYKRPEILLMCDSDLTQILGEDTSPRETLSHEYAALSDYCKSSLSEPRESLNSSQRRQHNLALFYSLNTLALIDELLRGIFRGDENSIEEWQNLRLQLLRHPTIAETTDDYPQLYLQAPKIPYGFSANLDAQWHQGSNTGRQIKLFDDALTPSMVGESECQLPLMMRNAIVREHFIAEGFATCWAAEPWVMTPGAYQNIYKGGLGEEAIKALLIDSGLILENLPQAVYERFDFIATNQQGLRIAIDAKHWASSGEAHQHEQKIQLLKQHCNVHHFAYINLIGLPNSSIECVDDELKPSKDANHSTLIIPGLIDAQTGATLEAHIAPLLTWKRAPK